MKITAPVNKSVRFIEPELDGETSAPKKVAVLDESDPFQDFDHSTFDFRRKVFAIYLGASLMMAFASAAVSLVLDLNILPYRTLLRGQIESTFIVMFAHSIFILMITSLGIFAYCRRGYKTAVTYCVFSITLFMLVAMVIVYSLAMRHEFHIHLHQTMLRGLRNYGEIPGAEINDHWDNLQMEFKCCGIYKQSDWSHNRYINHTLPDSCCSDPSVGCAEEEKTLLSTHAFFTQACYEPFKEWLNVYTYELIAFGTVLAIWQLIGFVVAWNLVRVTKKIPQELRLKEQSCCCLC